MLFVSLLIVSCAPPQLYYAPFKLGDTGSTYTVAVGSPMFIAWQHLKRNSPNGEKLFYPSSFEQEIVYHGIADSMIELAYHEYGNNRIRSAFEDRYVYNLRLSDTIAFRSLRFKILSAGTQSVTFTILALPQFSWEEGDVPDMSLPSDLMH
jgi:hypothetical protein